VRYLVLTVSFILFAFHAAQAAEPHEPVPGPPFLVQKPASGPLESNENPRLLDSADSPNEDGEYEERQFARRFNNLVCALREFSETYNASHVINAKYAKAVRKAMQQLEKSDGCGYFGTTLQAAGYSRF
jgi:hypothetical protein